MERSHTRWQALQCSPQKESTAPTGGQEHYTSYVGRSRQGLELTSGEEKNGTGENEHKSIIYGKQVVAGV